MKDASKTKSILKRIGDTLESILMCECLPCCTDIVQDSTEEQDLDISEQITKSSATSTSYGRPVSLYDALSCTLE